MTKKGYKSITISEPIFELAKEFIEFENRKGKKWRSLSQFVEVAITEYFKRRVEFSEKTKEAQNSPIFSK